MHTVSTASCAAQSKLVRKLTLLIIWVFRISLLRESYSLAEMLASKKNYFPQLYTNVMCKSCFLYTSHNGIRFCKMGSWFRFHFSSIPTPVFNATHFLFNSHQIFYSNYRFSYKFPASHNVHRNSSPSSHRFTPTLVDSFFQHSGAQISGSNHIT